MSHQLNHVTATFGRFVARLDGGDIANNSYIYASLSCGRCVAPAQSRKPPSAASSHALAAATSQAAQAPQAPSAPQAPPPPRARQPPHAQPQHSFPPHANPLATIRGAPAHTTHEIHFISHDVLRKSPVAPRGVSIDRKLFTAAAGLTSAAATNFVIHNVSRILLIHPRGCINNIRETLCITKFVAAAEASGYMARRSRKSVNTRLVVEFGGRHCRSFTGL